MSNIIKKGSEQNRSIIHDFFNVANFFDDSLLSRFENKFPSVNVSENENEYDLELVIPGFKKDDIKIKVDDDMLTISAENKRESEEIIKRNTPAGSIAIVLSHAAFTYPTMRKTIILTLILKMECLRLNS